MPISSSATAIEKKKYFRAQHQVKSVDQNDKPTESTLLKIEPALPAKTRRNLYVRSHSTLNASSSKPFESTSFSDPVLLETHTDGTVHVSRTQNEKEKQPDRISLDRRGLSVVPIVDGEARLRLLSLQHNLLSSLDGFTRQKFPMLVFLDVYDNQLEQIDSLSTLENLRVLLMGKNRIRKIEGLDCLKKIEVLDLHGNQITQVSGLGLLTELKVLNLAGNQIRTIGSKDLQGLFSLQELNLRRNRLRKLMGFAETTSLSKLFLSNNDLQSVDDISSLAKSSNIREISIDNNPVSLGGDCVSFLVSYLPQLTKLNNLQISEQARKAAMAWRRNKETTNTAFMDLTTDVCLNYRREEVISNARTNWELLRTQTKGLTNNSNSVVERSLKNLRPDSDIILTSLGKPKNKTVAKIKVPVLPDKKLNFVRSASQDTENSQTNTSSSNSGQEFFKLPPILVPIINKMEQKSSEDGGLKLSGSLSSIGPNVDSSVSSLGSGSDVAALSSEASSSSSEGESEHDVEVEAPKIQQDVPKILDKTPAPGSSSLLSVAPSNVTASTSSSEPSVSSTSKTTRNIRSALSGKTVHPKFHSRAATAKVRKQSSPAVPKDREQGGDYLIEICGRHLNVYGQGALRFIDKPWNASKANDVNTVKFNYINFNNITNILHKVKLRFPNIDNFNFKETNITYLGQLNALSEVQGLTSLYIDPEGNPIVEKDWKNYAIYRLAHWGLRIINTKEISEEEIQEANEEYQSLSDMVLWTLPEVLLQPLLVRLRIDINCAVSEHNAKKWLLSADPALKSVVSKEALQWKKGAISQEDLALRQKAKQYISGLIDETSYAMRKLRLLEEQWPAILHEFVQNTLLDYSQLDMYMKYKIQELNK